MALEVTRDYLCKGMILTTLTGTKDRRDYFFLFGETRAYLSKVLLLIRELAVLEQ
jgi:hypothetical protein